MLYLHASLVYNIFRLESLFVHPLCGPQPLRSTIHVLFESINGNKFYCSRDVEALDFHAASATSTSSSASFLGSGPKGPMSCRTQGWISRRPFVHLSVRPSPPPKLLILMFPLNNMENLLEVKYMGNPY